MERAGLSREPALHEVWRELVLPVDDGLALRSDTELHPEALTPIQKFRLDWLATFEPEIAAIQTIYEASKSGIPVKREGLELASQAAARILATIEEGERRFSQI